MKHDQVKKKFCHCCRCDGSERLVEENNDMFLVSKPMAIVNMPSGLGLGPYIFTAQQHSVIPIVKQNVVSWCITESTMAKKYAEGTTGLKLS